jgi:hypothetical protein
VFLKQTTFSSVKKVTSFVAERFPGCQQQTVATQQQQQTVATQQQQQTVATQQQQKLTVAAEQQQTTAPQHNIQQCFLNKI